MGALLATAASLPGGGWIRFSPRAARAGALLALDGIGAAPRMLGGTLSLGLPIEEAEYWPARLRAVTQAQVNAAARAVLANPLATTGWLLPA